MSLITTKNRYHLALDGVGLILQGSPDRIAYQMSQAPIYGNRFASGDRDYTDFSFWWYWAQTDFSGGIKREARWADDGKYFSSVGVNTQEQPGAILLANGFYAQGSVAKTMVWNDHGETGLVGVLVGRNTTDQKMRIVDATGTLGATVWEDSATGANESILCCDSFGGDGILLFGCKTVGSGASMLKKLTGTAVADLGTHTAGNGIYAIVCDINTDIAYLFTYDDGIYKYTKSTGAIAQLTTAYPLDQNATSYSFGHLDGKGAWISGDRIYFLVIADGYSHLYAYDITDNAYAKVFTFAHGCYPQHLIVRNGSVYIFGHNVGTGHLEIWKYVISSGEIGIIHEIGRFGDYNNIMVAPARGAEAIYFVVDDGNSAYRIWGIDNSDALWASIKPPTAYNTSVAILGVLTTGYVVIAKDGASGTNRFDVIDPQQDARSSTGNIVTSIYDGDIPAIDKLFNSITLNFEKLVNGYSIEVEYSIDEGETFTSLGSATYANTGDGVDTSKTLYFGSAVISKTMQLRITEATGGTASPVFKAFSVQHVPMVDYAKSWSLNINCATDLRTLDGGLVEKPGRELRGVLTRAWLTKSLVDFQDLDFATTAINDGAGLTDDATTITVDSTADFPEQGRLRSEQEEITYTGKTPTTFTGCVRGARGTAKAAHADNVVISNAYRVIITDLNERVPIALDGKWLEYTVGISIREA